MADPHRTVQRAAQQRGATAGDDAAGGGTDKLSDHGGAGWVRVIQAAGLVEQSIEHAGGAVGGVDFLQDGGGGVHDPVDAAGFLAHEGVPLALVQSDCGGLPQ